MRKRKNNSDLARAIEAALRLGEFISYKQSWDFVSGLEEAKKLLDRFLDGGEANLACELYELFLSGCYEKANEVDDSGGNLGMFFKELFCGWIKVRQAAGCEPAGTVRDIIGWLDRDDYGFCFDIEGDVALALDKEGVALFTKYLEDRFASAFATSADKSPKAIFDYPTKVRMTARQLKAVYMARRTVRPYVALCEKTLASPQDCENIATLYKKRGRNEEAMAWVERGLATTATRSWGNEKSHGLERLRRELLKKVGRKDDALQSAWAQFAEYPSSFAYEEMMRYVPRRDRGQWHDKAMTAAKDADLAGFMDLCVETKEIDLLAKQIDAAAATDLENISHFFSEKAAKALQRKHGATAARLRCAMAMRILDAGKSKYYDAALEHLRIAKNLHGKHGQNKEWQLVVTRIRANHHRKRGFLARFEEILAGGRPTAESFIAKARATWRRQTSG